MAKYFGIVVTLLIFLVGSAQNGFAHTDQSAKSGQTTVSGRVFGIESGLPVSGVRVELMSKYGIAVPRNIQTRSDERGRYSLSIPEGEWRIRATWGDNKNGSLLMTPVVESIGQPLAFDFHVVQQNPGRSWFMNHMLVPEVNESSQNVLEGVLVDVGTALPIEGVLISLTRDDSIEASYTAKTDSVGGFKVEEMVAGAYRFDTTKEGYFDPFPTTIVVSGERFVRSFLTTRERWDRVMAKGRTFRPKITDETGKSIRNIVSNEHFEHYGELRGTISSGGIAASGAQVQLLDTLGREFDRTLKGSANSEGLFRIRLILPGRYMVRITANGQSMDIPGYVIDAGTHELDFNF